MKKVMMTLAAVSIGSVMMCSAVQAGVAFEDVRQVVENSLERDGYNYSYDEDRECFELSFALDSTLGQTDVSVFVYEDQISAVSDSPLYFKDEQFEKMAIFTTLINNDMYYGQFRVDKDYGMVSCRSYLLIEDVLPGEGEVGQMISDVVNYLDSYGDGIAAICVSDADPYETYASLTEEE